MGATATYGVLSVIRNQSAEGRIELRYYREEHMPLYLFI